MLVSVALDGYTRNDAKEVLDAVHDLFRAEVSFGWAAVGLYAYWNPDSHELLYVGLARNLGNRFAQHNGLMSCPAKGCKREQIRDYFEHHDVLGFSVIAQSAHLQGMGGHFPEDVYDVMQNGEGQLIQAYVDATGAKPMWNRIGGSSTGQVMNVQRPSTIGEVVTNARDSLIVARRALRMLSAEPTSEWFEHTLHTARMHATEEALMGGGDANVLHWLERLRDEPRYGAELADRLERLPHRGGQALGVVGEIGPPGVGVDVEGAVACVLVEVVELACDLVLVPTGVRQLGGDLGAALVEGVGDVLEEDQPEDDVLVLRGVHRAAQLVGGPSRACP